jgi:hypothetical protein
MISEKRYVYNFSIFSVLRFWAVCVEQEKTLFGLFRKGTEDDIWLWITSISASSLCEKKFIIKTEQGQFCLEHLREMKGE